MPNRVFKTVFHNGEPDEKAIVTMGVTVNNGARFKKLDEKGRKNLSLLLKNFAKQVNGFAEEIDAEMYTTTTNKNK